MDFARYLPLSNRPRGDESGVSGDERDAVADTVAEAVRLLGDGPRMSSFLEDAGLASAEASDPPALVLQIRSGPRRRTRDLVRTVRALLRQTDAAGLEPQLAPLILGRVALHASTTASFDRRAVIAEHTVRSVDGEWSFGRGPALEGTSLQIVRFLLGLSEKPPQPPAVSAPTRPDTTI